MDTHSTKPDMGDGNLSTQEIEKKITDIPDIEDNEEKIEWDGSEAEFVVDDDAEKFDEEFSGIRLNFKLSDEEKEISADILKSSIKSRQDKLFKKKNIIRTAILAVVAVIFAVSYFLNYGIINLIMFIVCIAVIAVMWLLPSLYVRKTALVKLFNGEYDVKIYPDEVEINKTLDKAKQSYTIPMDEKGEFTEKENMLVLKDDQGRIFTIPIRTIEPSVIADVQAILETGMKKTDL